MGGIIPQIKDGKKVLFIGLPCHVAAVISLFEVLNIERDRLLAVDLLCRGTPQPEYLKEHIRHIEDLKGVKFVKNYFRDPKYGTQNYCFTLYNKNKKSGENPLYFSKVIGYDNFQIGYHKAFIYRDCCYRCKYARLERLGDITISDYLGIGKFKPEYTGERKKISCLLGNTESGLTVIRQLKDKYINVIERQVKEPTSSDPQFQHPSVDSLTHHSFIKFYEATGDFSSAADEAFKKIKRKNKMKIIFKYEYVKKAARKVKQILSLKQ